MSVSQDKAMDTEQPPRTFIRVPPDSIRLCAARLDLQVSEDVPSGLAEDVSFRIRQIADVSNLENIRPIEWSSCVCQCFCLCRVPASLCAIPSDGVSPQRTWRRL